LSRAASTLDDFLQPISMGQTNVKMKIDKTMRV